MKIFIFLCQFVFGAVGLAAAAVEVSFPNPGSWKVVQSEVALEDSRITETTLRFSSAAPSVRPAFTVTGEPAGTVNLTPGASKVRVPAFGYLAL